jgi:uncharacterized membrane protein
MMILYDVKSMNAELNVFLQTLTYEYFATEAIKCNNLIITQFSVPFLRVSSTNVILLCFICFHLFSSFPSQDFHF